MLKKFYGTCGIATIIMICSVTTASAELDCDNEKVEVSGTVTTENVTPTLQIGNIRVILDTDGEELFSETGSLVGNITGTDGYNTTLLSHVARFPKGNSFNTSNDEAKLAFPESNEYSPVRLFNETGNLLVDEEGKPCSFYIEETISNIERGTGVFRNVTSAEIFANGYISNCPNENKNYFELSGTFCME